MALPAASKASQGLHRGIFFPSVPSAHQTQVSLSSSLLFHKDLGKGIQVRTEGGLLGDYQDRMERGKGNKSPGYCKRSVNELINWAELMNVCAPFSVLPAEGAEEAHGYQINRNEMGYNKCWDQAMEFPLPISYQE